MTRNANLMLAVLLAVSPAIHAQDIFLTSLRYEADRYQWRHVGADMSPVTYGEALRHNRRVARETLTNTIVSIGVPKIGLNLMGAAVALAIDDLKVPLNKSKTLALKLDDATNEDRSATLQIKLTW